MAIPIQVLRIYAKKFSYKSFLNNNFLKMFSFKFFFKSIILKRFCEYTPRVQCYKTFYILNL